jgi:hypothetical protein
MVTENVPVQKVVFTEVCRPGACNTVHVPDACRRYGAVEVEPSRTEWVKVKCTDPCTCCEEDCWKAVRVPPKFKWCEKIETEQGFLYCSNAPTQYDVVATTVTACEKVERYVPCEPKVQIVQELYAPGHWVWEKRYDCRVPSKCPPPFDCAPLGPAYGDDPCPCPCGPSMPVKGDFRRAPER